MEWKTYKKDLRKNPQFKKLKPSAQEGLVKYANNLFQQNLPIIYDQNHLALLIGIDTTYLHAMSNKPKEFYHTFYITKNNGKRRRIDEPYPDLKKVQAWILKNILYNVSCSKYAKAYIPDKSITDNTRFHKNQKIVMTVDIKDFFPSIQFDHVLNKYFQFGYSKAVAYILASLTCYRNSLPQGAPTSAYMSNLILDYFDNKLASYCSTRKIRYTRYADDMTFSGEFNIKSLLQTLDFYLTKMGMTRNRKKLKIMRKGHQQMVTGIIVNTKKQQLSKNYRMLIRQEVYYINKYGLDSHVEKKNILKANYIKHLYGKIQYCLFVNPNDEKMKYYQSIIKAYL
ncbi:MAG: reverse transcriptase domain-containing protein [Anaerofustis sp.]